MAIKPRYQGSGSSIINPTQLLNAHDEIAKYTDHLIFAQGYEAESDRQNPGLEMEALIAVYKSDKVIVFAGLPDSYESEGFDRKHLNLPQNQNILIEKLAEKNRNVIVVLFNGSPVAMPWLDKVKGVIECGLAGQAAGGAVADILFGTANPGGKLAETYPMDIADTPCFNYFPCGPKTVEYRESIYVGYRYYQKTHKEVLFPFGYGLSYTKFAYSDLKFEAKTVDGLPEITARFNIKNIGDRRGKEIAQLYIKDMQPRIFKPLMELKGFVKVDLFPGESKGVELKLNRKSFRFFDARDNRWKMCSGDYEVLIGASSEDIRLKSKISVQSADDFEAVLTPEQIPTYYELPLKKFAVPTLEFKALYGKELPLNEATATGSFNMESTLGDMKNTKVGKILYRFVVNQQQKTEMKDHKKQDDEDKKDLDAAKKTQKLMMAASIDELPMKSLVVNSGGLIDYEMAHGILQMINGNGKAGFSQLKEAYFAKKSKSSPNQRDE